MGYHIHCDVIISTASDIAHLIDGDNKNVLSQCNTAMQKVLTPIYKELGLEGKQDEDEIRFGLLRRLILGTMGNYENEEVKQQGLKLFGDFIGGNVQAVDAALKSTVFSIGMKFDTAKDFKSLKAFYGKADDPAMKDIGDDRILWESSIITFDAGAVIELFGKTIEADKQVAGKDMCSVLGKTGAGKSAIHFLAGSTMEKNPKTCHIQPGKKTNEYRVAESRKILLHYVVASGVEVDIANGLRIVQSVSKERSVKILVRYVSKWCCITTIKCNIKSYGWCFDNN